MTTPTYNPDDSQITAQTLAFLHSPQGELLRNEATNLLERTQEPTVADIARLRKSFPPAALHAALAIAKLQPRAHQKFPEFAHQYIWAIPEALEQATDSAVARHKAARFRAALPAKILDLCCGIGGDTLALQSVAPTQAIDLSAPRLACLRYNAQALTVEDRIETTTADIADILTQAHPPTTFFHLDPARRTAGRRITRWHDLIPGPEILIAAIHKFPAGAIKLGPGIDFDSLPPGHLELISHNRSVVQAVLWLGQFAQSLGENLRTATTLAHGKVTATFTAAPDHSSDLAHQLPQEGDVVYEADGAFTRAALAGPLARSLNLAPLTADGGYLLAPANAPAHHHGALTAFQVLSALPYSEKQVVAALRAQAHVAPALPGEGPIEVKTRGKIPGIDTDHLQKLFATATPLRHTVLIYRRHHETTAIIATRISALAYD